MTDPPTAPLTAPSPTLSPEPPPAPSPDRPVDGWLPRWLILSMALTNVAIGAWLVDATYRADLGISELVTYLSSTFVALTCVYTGRGRPRGVGFWAVAAFTTTTITAVTTLGGRPWWLSAWFGFVNIVAATVAIVVYRRGLKHDGWEPRTPASLVGLLSASAVAVAIVVVLMGHPAQRYWPPDARQQLWWALRIFTGMWIGPVTFLVIAYWRLPPAIGRRVRLVEGVVVYALGIGCIVLGYTHPELPITWLCLVPGLWAGLVFSPRAAAVYCLVVAGASGAAVGFWEDIFVYTGGILPPALLIDLMICFATFLTMLLALFRDQRLRMLTELRERRATARMQADLMRAMVDSMSDGLVLSDQAGRVRLQNPAARALLGRPMPASPPESWARYFGVRSVEGDREVTDDELPLPTRGHANRLRADFRLVGDDGHSRVLSAESRLVRSRTGPQVLLLFHDVSAEHARYRELRSFAGTVAHDLKGPLAAVSGWMEAADDELAADDPLAGRLALTKAREASARMRRLIDDYLSFAVTREGMLRLAAVPLEQVVRDVVGVYETHTADAPDITVDVPHSVHADRGLLHQLVANLVGNALKYRLPGERAHLQIRSMDAEPGWVRIEFADRGRGLQPGDEERIFAAFSRSDKDAEHVSGTGLGLALCHSIVTRHGGRISAARNEHGGATFAVTLPTP